MTLENLAHFGSSVFNVLAQPENQLVTKAIGNLPEPQPPPVHNRDLICQ